MNDQESRTQSQLTPSSYFSSIFFWLFTALAIGVLAGSASALFLWSLDRVTDFRSSHLYLVYGLPFAGALIAFLYSRFGTRIEGGNNLIIEELHNPQKTIPFRMAPFVLLGTLTTHLFGGSAGREGTAVQMGASLADQLNFFTRFDKEKRKTLLMAGISAGFASVFGTPLAGALFGLEVLLIERVRYQALLPCFIAAIVADRVCTLWGIHHTIYSVTEVPLLGGMTFLATLVAGACFGLCAWFFSKSYHRLSAILRTFISSPPPRAFVGGVVVLAGYLVLQSDRYLGLGIPAIQESFLGPVPVYDFALKILFTIVTLSAGFKGGEVTPLFFIGATLGNALTWILPLPTSLLAGMGFVAVFAGAANTPLTCVVMALELFGTQSGIYMALACVVSYLFSGHHGIYHKQKFEVFKYAQKN